jgi:hypothetical protein
MDLFPYDTGNIGFNYCISKPTRSSMKRGKTNRNEKFKAKVTASRKRSKIVKDSRKKNR